MQYSVWEKDARGVEEVKSEDKKGEGIEKEVRKLGYKLYGSFRGVQGR